MRAVIAAALVAALLLPLGASAAPTAPIKIGFVFSYSGVDTQTGREADAAMAAYIAQHGDTVAGRKVEIIKRDDTGLAPEVARRIATELIIQDHVDFLAGTILTPDAIAVADVSTQAHVPFLIVNAGQAGIPANNPYTFRFGYTNAQLTQPLTQWLVRNGMKTAFSLYVNYGPGVEIATLFAHDFAAAGGKMVGDIAMPYNANDFSAYLQRVKDSHAQALFVFHNGNGGINLMKAADQAELAKNGVTIVTVPEVVRPSDLPTVGDAVLGNISALNYLPSLDTPLNHKFVKAFQASYGGPRLPSFDGVASYDILDAIYRVVAAQHGDLNLDRTMALLKNMSFISPRGPFKIDPQTREPIENVYIRRVEKRNGVLNYQTVATIPMVKVPASP